MTRIAPGGFGVEIDVDGDVQISRELLRFAGRVTDASPVFRDIADDLREIEEGQFSSEGGRGSGGWKALKAETVAAKRAAGLDNGILKATEAMFRSLTQKSDPHHVEEITKDSLRFGSTDEKLPIHQAGAPANNLPQRRPLELTALDRTSITKKLQRFMVSGVSV